jgi:excinuclease UvrABC nuclease subunit
MKNNNKVIPVFYYPNTETFKVNILLDNNNKSGIYKWTNNINNKSYVGSVKSLNDRLNIYYSLTTLKKRLETSSSAIYSALLKYNYNNFSL